MNYHSNFWNKYFTYYDTLMQLIPYQNLLKSLASALKISNGDRVLDLGCGTGNIQYFLGSKANVYSFDQSKEALSRLSTKFPDARISRGSIIEKLPFEDNYFDKVVMNNVLYTLHRDQWSFVIEEIHRVCKEDGIIAVSSLKENFKAIDIYKDHVDKSIKKKGYWRTLVALGKLFYPTIQIFRYNRTISKNNEEGHYSFIVEDEQKEAFEERGFSSLANSLSVYSGQAVLNSFIKI